MHDAKYVNCTTHVLDNSEVQQGQELRVHFQTAMAESNTNTV